MWRTPATLTGILAPARRPRRRRLVVGLLAGFNHLRLCNLAAQFRQALSEGRHRSSVEVQWRIEGLEHDVLDFLK